MNVLSKEAVYFLLPVTSAVTQGTQLCIMIKTEKDFWCLLFSSLMDGLLCDDWHCCFHNS